MGTKSCRTKWRQKEWRARELGPRPRSPSHCQCQSKWKRNPYTDTRLCLLCKLCWAIGLLLGSGLAKQTQSCAWRWWGIESATGLIRIRGTLGCKPRKPWNEAIDLRIWSGRAVSQAVSWLYMFGLPDTDSICCCCCSLLNTTGLGQKEDGKGGEWGLL